MIIEPKIRGFICTTAHPTGCYNMVAEQITYVQQKGKIDGPTRVLVIGSSTGYGLASRIVSGFGVGAKTIGVAFEREAENNRTASPGWYNTAAFEQLAHKAGLYAKSIIGDAFSDEIKNQTLDLIARDLGQIDLVIYSLAAPKRIHPKTGVIYQSVLKPIGQNYHSKTINVMTGELKNITLEAATEEEIANTTAVMGGDDWAMWIDALNARNLLAHHATTVAYSYIGPVLTYPIYTHGTIGSAKKDLQQTAQRLNTQLKKLNGHAYISVNKALVTQASAAIPVVPLYISVLYKVMREKQLHEGCIEQMWRLFAERLYGPQPMDLDNEGRIRLDDYEMRPDVQQMVAAMWEQITPSNVPDFTDLAQYRHEFYRLFGFEVAHVNYQEPVSPIVTIPSLLSPP